MRSRLLIRRILKRSISDLWQRAKLEWRLAGIHESEVPRTCLCGHSPITELCTLENKRNGKRTVVCNECVSRICGMPSKKMFAAVKKVKSDHLASFNEDLIELASELEWMNDWEYRFYVNTSRNRNLSKKQRRKKREINRMILRQIAAGRLKPAA